MVRLKVAMAGSAVAGVLAGGLAIPPAASADTTQVVYAWGDNQRNQTGVDNQVAGTEVLILVLHAGLPEPSEQLCAGADPRPATGHRPGRGRRYRTVTKDPHPAPWFNPGEPAGYPAHQDLERLLPAGRVYGAVAAAFPHPVHQHDQGSWLEVALVPGA